MRDHSAHSPILSSHPVHGPTLSSHPVHDTCCCFSHCNLAHNPGVPLHAYKALKSRIHVGNLTSPLPCSRDPFFDPVLENDPPEKPSVDGLAQFLLSLDSAVFSSFSPSGC